MYRTFIRTALIGLAALGLCAQAHASTCSVDQSQWTGTCTTGVGLDGGGKWGSTGCQISWNITCNSKTNDYTYTWTVCGLHGTNINPSDINHFIIGCGSSFCATDILKGTSSTATCGSWGSKNNPGLPCSFDGVDFNFGGGKCTYTLVTDCAPVWGDCYGTDGKTNDICNAGFCNDGGQGCNNPGNCEYWIPCPGNPCPPCTVVPLPSSVWMGLATLGALALAGWNKRRNVRLAMI